MSELIRGSRNVALAQHWAQRGAGRFEFAVVAIIFAILTGVLLQKMRFYQAEAERLAIQQVVGSLRAALAARASSLYLEGKHGEIALLATQNPMDWLARRPPNYAGEFEQADKAAVAPGNWYFDRSNKRLLYSLSNTSFFGESSAKRLNFKVKFLTKSNDEPGPGGVTLEQID